MQRAQIDGDILRLVGGRDELGRNGVAGDDDGAVDIESDLHAIDRHHLLHRAHVLAVALDVRSE